MLFLQISTDYVQLLNAHEEKLIYRNDVEKQLWPVLVERFRTYGFKDILVLNWPGGFTNLRVGALCLNLLATLEAGKFQIWDLSKLKLFQFAQEKWLLPPLGAVYIGQKKTLWLYDFQDKNYTVVKKEELPYVSDIFFDKVYDEEYFTQDIKNREINFVWEDRFPVMTCGQEKLVLNPSYVPAQKVDALVANYMVQPVMN